MRKVALRISSLLLCGLLIYNSLGYFLVLSVMRVAVRHQKWARLSTLTDQNLTIFIFNKNSPDPELKIVNEHEIIVKGRLYDVVSKNVDGKHIKYTCARDQQEETLISKTRQFNSNAQQMPLRNTARLMVDKIIKTAIANEVTDSFSVRTSHPFRNFCKLNYSDPKIQIPLLPPESFSIFS